MASRGVLTFPSSHMWLSQRTLRQVLLLASGLCRTRLLQTVQTSSPLSDKAVFEMQAQWRPEE